MKDKFIYLCGERYDFDIVIEKCSIDCYFHVRAICRDSKRTSCINNLNPMLSLFSPDCYESEDDYCALLDDPDHRDSSWVISKGEAKKLAKIAEKALRDSSFLRYLEDKLDEDRLEGEWKNIYDNGELIECSAE